MTARVRRPTIRRAIIYLPNGFTLFNLFCGIFAVVLASRQDFAKAALFVFLGGIADALDGRVARATGSGSRMGEELDSLVDAISFGFAPAMIMYFAVFNTENWEWLFVFMYTAGAVLRLARFNVEQAGRAKTYFHGLPSPAAGLTLATYYWFSQTPLYNQAIILFTDNKTLSELPWHAMLPGLMGLLAVLMVSNVPYPAVPIIGWKSLKQLTASVVLIVAMVLSFFRPRQFFFPALLAYVLYGALKWMILGLIGSRSQPEELYFQLEPEEELAAAASAPSHRRTPPVGVQPAASTESDGVSTGRRRRRRRRRSDGQRGERPSSGESQERSGRSDRPNRLTPNRPSRLPSPPNDSLSAPKPPTLIPPPSTAPKDDTE
ncbi:MAG TPA: CDP-diacylglycerol--serine O-phosphatidyltransferase [Gemmatimonadaceae bacterium]|jgi:CDP-diacylglycerol--serine O-phosphatidyltransferase